MMTPEGELSPIGQEAATKIQMLQDTLDAIDALHQPFDETGWKHQFCEECDIEWPCPTARLLHPMTLKEAIDILGTIHK
jgi:hypothetical protein